jgi:sulfur-carrier protein
MIRVVLPSHLRALARIHGEIELHITGPVTHCAVLDALEARYPTLRGTIRGHDGGPRRAYIRLFACEQDLSHQDPHTPLPEPVTSGAEPYLIVAAMAGG